MRQVYADCKILLKSANLSKFTAWCPDVPADKPHPPFDTKILEQKRCSLYVGVYSNEFSFILSFTPEVSGVLLQ